MTDFLTRVARSALGVTPVAVPPSRYVPSDLPEGNAGVAAEQPSRLRAVAADARAAPGQTRRPTNPPVRPRDIVEEREAAEITRDPIPPRDVVVNRVVAEERPHESMQTREAVKAPEVIEKRDVIEPRRVVQPREVAQPREIVERREVLEPREVVETREVVQPRDVIETREVIDRREVIETREAITPREVVLRRNVVERRAEHLHAEQPSRPADEQPPVVRITIGRVDVRAAALAPPPPDPPDPAAPRISLDDYLRQHSEGRKR